MHTHPLALTLVGAASLPLLTQAAELTVDLDLNNYSGDGAYLVLYLTDAQGQYQRTLWVAGKKAKYYKHLRDWAAAGNRPAEYDGLTGASVGSGEHLKVTAEVADALLNAGYQIRVDSAVEDHKEYRAEVRLPIEGPSGQTQGSGYVRQLSYQF